MFENGTINGALDFWTFIGMFALTGGVILGGVWTLIRRFVKGKK
jgi:hypothetical protein